MMKIMLADDDESIRMTVKHMIEKDGYEFCYASDGEETLRIVESESPDLLILDVMMPVMNGFDVCAALRKKRCKIPIIFLSAKGDIVDKTIGFKHGGDDYLVKPFSYIELSLRIEALLRRYYFIPNEASYEKQNGSVKFDELEIFYNRYEVRLRNKKVNLTSKEFEILAFLSSYPGQVFTRQQILEQIWGKDTVSDINSITVFMRKIREKIEDDPAKPKYLLTVWRVGYKFFE